MPWVVFQKNRYAPPIEAIEVEESMTADQVSALLGSDWWVPMDASSAEEAIAFAVAGGFKSDTYDSLPIEKDLGSGSVTIKQSLALKRVLRSFCS